jgi:hypothetical protein
LWSTDGWLLDHGVVDGWEKEIKRLRNPRWGFRILGFQFRDFFCSEHEWWNVKRRLHTWFGDFAIVFFALLKPIGGQHMSSTLHFYLLRVNSFNRWWNHDFTRFHPILPISKFYERFSTSSLCWLLKSYDFTSWITILTTLLIYIKYS